MQAVSGAFSGLAGASGLGSLASAASTAASSVIGSGPGGALAQLALALINQAQSLATTLPTQLADLSAPHKVCDLVSWCCLRWR